jgi:N-acetylmuramoyl-L-alanine amidase
MKSCSGITKKNINQISGFIVYVLLFISASAQAVSTSGIAVISPDGTRSGIIPIRTDNGVDRLSLTQWSLLVDAELMWDYVSGKADMRFRDHHLRFVDSGRGVWINGRMHSLPGKILQQGGDIWVPIKILDDLVDVLWEGSVIWHPAERELRRFALRPRLTDIRGEEHHDGRLVIALDAGHGGSDSGCLSRDGVMEKDVVLAISNRVADIVANRMGAHVELTRMTDVDVSFEERIGKANAARADIFISFHIAPAEEMSGRSFGVYTLPEGRAASEIASKPVLWESRSQSVIDLTRDYAEKFAEGMAVTANMKDYTVQSRDMMILKGLTMPAFVLELSWNSSYYGNTEITEEAGANRAAEAVFDGIRGCLETE